ncbi:hypothetical protein EVAR_76615_1 [Eumeta japonica]|uniref:Uncharacterized protein n=1 Tax=Eumeta variegata TaxID=151549 RepID=A0A4C1T616_EUMVA|nr:hypothetical protein EVAR_76615_1 [Eumeta japonica]
MRAFTVNVREGRLLMPFAANGQRCPLRADTERDIDVVYGIIRARPRPAPAPYLIRTNDSLRGRTGDT